MCHNQEKNEIPSIFILQKSHLDENVRGYSPHEKKVQSPIWRDCTLVQILNIIFLRLAVVEQDPIAPHKR